MESGDCGGSRAETRCVAWKCTGYYKGLCIRFKEVYGASPGEVCLALEICSPSCLCLLAHSGKLPR